MDEWVGGFSREMRGELIKQASKLPFWLLSECIVGVPKFELISKAKKTIASWCPHPRTSFQWYFFKFS